MKREINQSQNQIIIQENEKLDISKALMYELWYDYINRKYGDRENIYYMDTDSFIIHIITEDFREDIANDV